MTKDVLISISGLQFAGGENSEPVEVITSGSYYKKNGRHYILYDEVAEDTAGTTKNIIKLGDEVLDITKRGETNVHMMFEKDKKNVTYYYTPYGNLLIGIDATKVQVEETEHNLSVKVDYALEVNYEHMADCKITMNIQAKNAGDFKICHSLQLKSLLLVSALRLSLWQVLPFLFPALHWPSWLFPAFSRGNSSCPAASQEVL